MFILDQIKQAYDKVQTETDFKNYIQELIELGIKGYDTLVTDGRVVYYGDTNHEAATDKKYDQLKSRVTSLIGAKAGSDQPVTTPKPQAPV